MHPVPKYRRPLSTSLRTPTGFTLVEILIVVVIIAILAAIVVPQFTSAANQTRENSLKMDLFRVRQQIEVYSQQHDGHYPSLTNFSDQLTKPSTADGTTASTSTIGHPFGPYLHQIPVNPFTSGNQLSSDAVGSSDWYYDPSTGAFRANDSTEHRAY